MPTGTNLLGLVKHLAIVETSYFGAVFDRPFPEPLPWWDDDAEPNSDMWATPGESRDDVVGLCQRACAHADATIAALPLDTVGTVSWWRDGRVTLHRLLVHVTAETHRHAGHADLVRELIDGAAVGDLVVESRALRRLSTTKSGGLGADRARLASLVGIAERPWVG